jgi:GNAT superfamily N-acetyltransferase
MANADIVIVGMRELPLIVDLFNDVFRPPRDMAYFERRLRGRVQSLILVAQIQDRPAGFALGYEIKPGTFYCWLIGVQADFRRAGVASQLMEAMAAWARDNGYHTIRFECYNRQRPMLHLAISQNYDIVGLRFDIEAGTNLIILEHVTSDAVDEDDMSS